MNIHSPALSYNTNPHLQDKDDLHLQTLLTEKDQLTIDGKYLEAEAILSQINEHKRKTMTQKITTLKDYQQIERQDLIVQYQRELETLNDYWDEKILDNEINANQYEEQTKANHLKLIETFIEEANRTYKPMRYDKEYNECKTMELNMAKRDRYQEAHYYQLKCNKIEKEIIEKYNREKDNSIRTQTEIYKSGLEKELDYNKERLKVELGLLKSQKDKEIIKLNKRFNNKRNELGAVHAMQNRISQNENHLRATVTSNRISTLMRTTTSKASSHNRKMGNCNERYIYNNSNTVQSETKEKKNIPFMIMSNNANDELNIEGVEDKEAQSNKVDNKENPFDEDK